MDDYVLGAIESRFADIIWENAPLSTRELVDFCQRELEWKRTTTYTVLKKLCNKGLFQMEDKTVTVLVSKQEYYAFRTEKFVEETFDGSLPAMVVAFGSRKQLTDEEIDALQNIVNKMRR